MNAEQLLENLTPPQREAVSHTDGPLLVLAGAGSGKTRVITRRAVYIATTVARPDEVLAITFTNKAAGEMRERIASLGVRAGMWVQTFHSLCARLLRMYGQAVHVAPNFTIFDDADRRSLLREVIIDRGLATDNWSPAMVEGVIGDAKNRMIGPEQFAAEAMDFTAQTIAPIYRSYQDRMAEQNVCDFDDLLLQTARLLEQHEDVRTMLSQRFRYVLIDEYQDTNRAQYVIASLLASTHRNICATGDPDQSIYAWRGADIRNILDFESQYPDATIVRLEQNFRSTGAILSAASSLISQNRRRKKKDLWTADEIGEPVRVWTCEDEREEATQIARDIKRHLDEGGRGGDIAIFYRINALSRVMEDALRAEHIPYQIARGVEFYRRKEIKDMIAFLRAIANPADDAAIVRAIESVPRGIGKTTLERLKADARSKGDHLDDALQRGAAGTNAAAKRLAAFVGLLNTLRGMPKSPVTPIVETVLKDSGLEAALQASREVDNEPLANVYELVNAARQFDVERPEGALIDWLEQISLVSDADALAEGGGPVTLMTMHTAKGLEYPVVFIIGLEEGLLPHHRALRGEQNELEEERRLCFVGMTRAMRLLTLSHARYRMVRGITERTIASRFLGEVPKDEIERQTFETQRERSWGHLGRSNFGEDPPPENVSDDYYPGRRVRHEDYGVGEVMGLDRRGRSTYIRIHFDAFGERSFAVEHVSLYVLD